ncbi:MAG: AMP-binding protein [Bacteroidales bacterium]|nr:AMP-binding protein [Bacteroidales bacterium]
MRRIFNTALDLVTGFSMQSGLSAVLEMDNWQRGAIDQYQCEKFEKLREYAVRSEIYKNHVGSDLSGFLLFSKEFVQENFNRFRTNIRKPYSIEYTSGSTGNPKKVVVSKEMIQAKRIAHLKMLTWYDLKREDKEVYIGGLAQPSFKKFYYFLKNKVYLPSNNITKQKAREYIRIINRHKPRILFSYPYALDIILSYAEQMKKNLHQPEVVYTGGENMEPHIKNHLIQHFPYSSIVNEYWATEANIGVTCPSGNMHADEDTIIIETVNQDEDGFGDILITNLYSYDMPLIRYDLGDRIKLSDAQCPCGRKTMIIEEIRGRTVDYYYLKDGRRIAYMDMRISRFVDNVIVYQVVHHKKDDTFLFKYVLREHSRSMDTESLHHFFRKNLGIELYFKEVDHIHTEPSGKFRVFASI